METKLVYLDDAYLKSVEATVIDRRDDAVALDRTVLYPTGGGQPHDTGMLRSDGASIPIDSVKKEGMLVWHHLDFGDAAETKDQLAAVVGISPKRLDTWSARKTHSSSGFGSV